MSFLLPLLHIVNLNHDSCRLETMRKEGGREGRAKVAVAARRLMSLAKEVEGVEGAEKVGDSRLRHPRRESSPRANHYLDRHGIL